MEKSWYHCLFAYALLILLVLSCTCLAKRNTSLATDEPALLALKAHITSDPYHILTTNWSTTNSSTSSVCSWIGVTCGIRHRRVTGLNISYMGLSGTIPPQLGNLSFLVSLDLKHNLFSGTLPQELSLLGRLKYISLTQNKLVGEIPSWLGLLPKLEHLSLRHNSFTGVIPKEISQLQQLEELQIVDNRLSGTIPDEVFNISTLRFLILSANDLSGSLPTIICHQSHVLEDLYLPFNSLSGPIPDSISNCSNLKQISFCFNKFTGFVPHALGKLRLLEDITLGWNNLRSESSSELSFIISLTNCTSLKTLTMDENPLDGIIPASIGNLSSSLEDISLSNCKIRGSLPVGIGNLTNLVGLKLLGNQLSGKIPLSVKHLHKLQGLYLADNNMTGSIAEGLCELPSLVVIYLSQNQFSGSIPQCLGNATSLRDLILASNKLSSSIPSSLWNLKDLLNLDLSSNYLIGFLPPEIGNLEAAIYINLSTNQLSDSIPNTIGNLKNLINLSLAHNTLSGPFPESVGNMISLVTLDFSNNNLSGSIPKSLETLEYLLYFNVSSNALSGEIPTAGPFVNFSMDSFKGNEALCGTPRFHVPLCHTVGHRSNKKFAFSLFILCGLVVLITFACLAFIFIRYRKRKRKTTSIMGELVVSTAPQRISYYEILQATQQLNECNLLGIGSFGRVFKGVLTDGITVAVKVFNLQLEAAFKSFDVECEVLRNIRHRNLTKVISSCSNEEFKALVLEYMPNGSLEKWLYSHNYCLDAMQRLKIMIDVASGLEYLHHGYSAPIAHCDLKPSNVLVDEEMTAHVSDFGIAKLFGDGESIMVTNTLATLGYIAPEYGLEGLVSTRCDVYSYGVMLMETFTRKKPTDDMFSEDLSLKRWVESLLLQSPYDVIDANLMINLDEKELEKNVQCVSLILQLALNCCVESPRDRINMIEAVAELKKIKIRFLQ
ncbi:hypothetical protein C2S51_016535 [Perilla frutescens var. frutescens]|nr:hypothetical protein C2S51_016535 [Perilla frutescens var. frutescens]